MQADCILITFYRGDNYAVDVRAFMAITDCSATLFAPNLIISLSFLRTD
jgi:hypothetical protein